MNSAPGFESNTVEPTGQVAFYYTDTRRINTLRVGFISIDGVDYDTPLVPTIKHMGTDLRFWTLNWTPYGPALAWAGESNIILNQEQTNAIGEFVKAITLDDTVIELYDEKGFPKKTILRRDLPKDWKGGWTYEKYGGGRMVFRDGKWIIDPQVAIEQALAKRDDIIKMTEAKINRYERQKKFGLPTTWTEEQYYEAFIYLEALYNMGSAPGFPEVLTYPEVPYFM